MGSFVLGLAVGFFVGCSGSCILAMKTAFRDALFSGDQ